MAGTNHGFLAVSTMPAGNMNSPRFRYPPALLGPGSITPSYENPSVALCFGCSGSSGAKTNKPERFSGWTSFPFHVHRRFFHAPTPVTGTRYNGSLLLLISL